MPHELSPVEVRVLAALVEKELATPQNYPLTANALRTACNQTTGRNPVVHYDDATIADALGTLRAAGWTRIVYSPSNRAPKHRHVLGEHLGLDEAQVATLAVLALRGPQTPGEVKARTERMHHFSDVGEVESVLAQLASGDDPLVARIAPRPGQKEARWAHLLSGEVVDVGDPVPAGGHAREDGRCDELAAEVGTLRDELSALRAEFDAFRAEFS